MSCVNASFLKNTMIFLAIVSFGITAAFVADYVDTAGGWEAVTSAWLK